MELLLLPPPLLAILKLLKSDVVDKGKEDDDLGERSAVPELPSD